MDGPPMAQAGLFGLQGLAPLAAAVAPPRRPEPGRGRGRPRRIAIEVEAAPPAGTIAPLAPVALVTFDYSDLEAALREAEAAMRRTRLSLDQLAAGRCKPPTGTRRRRIQRWKTPMTGTNDRASTPLRPCSSKEAVVVPLAHNTAGGYTSGISLW
jgi:hypothetical protein